MRLAGILLIVVGLFLAAGAWGMDTTVPGPDGQRVHNVGLIADRQLRMIVAGVFFLAGIILDAIGYATRRKKTADEAPPYMGAARPRRDASLQRPQDDIPPVARREDWPDDPTELLKD